MWLSLWSTHCQPIIGPQIFSWRLLLAQLFQDTLAHLEATSVPLCPPQMSILYTLPVLHLVEPFEERHWGIFQHCIAWNSVVVPWEMIWSLRSCGNQSGGVWALALEELMLENMKCPRFSLYWSNGEIDLTLPPFGGLQSLCSALSSCAGSRGRLTMTKCYLDECDPLYYDMVGEWESGHFYAVSAREFL